MTLWMTNPPGVDEERHLVWDSEVKDWVEKPIPNRLNKLFDRVEELENRLDDMHQRVLRLEMQ